MVNAHALWFDLIPIANRVVLMAVQICVCFVFSETAWNIILKINRRVPRFWNWLLTYTHLKRSSSWLLSYPSWDCIWYIIWNLFTQYIYILILFSLSPKFVYRFWWSLSGFGVSNSGNFKDISSLKPGAVMLLWISVKPSIFLSLASYQQIIYLLDCK